MTVEVQLRKAIVDSGLTHYRITKRTGIATSVIDGFVAGKKDIRVSTVNRLCETFGMQLTPPQVDDKQDANKRPTTPAKRRSGSSRAKKPARKQG